MKNIILTMIGVLISIYTLGICFGITSIAIRQNILEEHVSRVLIRTLKEEYQTQDAKEAYDKLHNELKLNVGNNGYVDVEIQKMDLDKGVIHVVVKEHFRQVNGKEKTITCEKTVIVDEPVKATYSAGALAAINATPQSDVYSNAYAYYQEYEGAMLFKPTDDTEAGVFYGTRAKESSSGKLVFETLGWRVTVKDKDGQIMDQVYYALDGQYIRIADDRSIDGYKYKLYNISLDTLKKRLSASANDALKKADCTIVFDACVVVKRNGVRKGGITDNGIEWGTVYTTYDGIVNAVNWSAKTKELLKSYFNKEIADMFFEVSLSCGTGIESVSGSGRYCYGTEVTIDAVPQSGHSFLNWVGSFATTEKRHTFTVYEDVKLQAVSTRDAVAVHFYRNRDSRDECIETIYYSFDSQVKKLPAMEWTNPGFYQTGWSTSRIIAQPYFDVEQIITEDWLGKVAPSVNLYATWAPKRSIAEDIRFISAKYYKDAFGNWVSQEEGGLSDTSIWKLDEEYRAILDEIFMNQEE